MTGPRSLPPIPILITLRIRFPVYPFHSPLRIWFAKAAILSSTACTWGTTCVPRSSESGMQNCAIFRDIDLVTTKHGIDTLPQTTFFGQLNEQPECVVGDTILRIVEEQTHGFCRHSLATLWVISKELAQVHFPNPSKVCCEGLPCLPLHGKCRDCLRRRHFGFLVLSADRPFCSVGVTSLQVQQPTSLAENVAVAMANREDSSLGTLRLIVQSRWD